MFNRLFDAITIMGRVLLYAPIVFVVLSAVGTFCLSIAFGIVYAVHPMDFLKSINDFLWSYSLQIGLLLGILFDILSVKDSYQDLLCEERKKEKEQAISEQKAILENLKKNRKKLQNILDEHPTSKITSSLTEIIALSQELVDYTEVFPSNPPYSYPYPIRIFSELYLPKSFELAQDYFQLKTLEKPQTGRVKETKEEILQLLHVTTETYRETLNQLKQQKVLEIQADVAATRISLLSQKQGNHFGE